VNAAASTPSHWRHRCTPALPAPRPHLHNASLDQVARLIILGRSPRLPQPSDCNLRLIDNWPRICAAQVANVGESESATLEVGYAELPRGGIALQTCKLLSNLEERQRRNLHHKRTGVEEWVRWWAPELGTEGWGMSFRLER
jgi:hypothetical protein